MNSNDAIFSAFFICFEAAATRHKEWMTFSPGKICSQTFISLLLASRHFPHTAAKSVYEMLPKKGQTRPHPTFHPQRLPPLLLHQTRSCCATTAQIRYGKSIWGIKNKTKQKKLSSDQLASQERWAQRGEPGDRGAGLPLSAAAYY